MKISNIFRWLIIKGYSYFSFGKITVRKTGSIYNLPKLRTINCGKISIDSHCMLENIELYAVNGGNIEIGHHSALGSGDLIVCHDCVKIGNNCSIAPKVTIYDHDHKFNTQGIQSGYKTKKVIIGNNVWIGTGVIILKGTEIGDNCVIGAGSIVQGSIPTGSIVKSNRELIIQKIRGDL